jgi:hypothetical protein
VESQELFKALAERFPYLRLETNELEYRLSITFRTLKSLPVTWNWGDIMARKLQVWMDHKVWAGNAMCETIAPNVFRLHVNRQSEAVDSEGDTVKRSWMRRRAGPSVPSSWKMRRRGNAYFRSLSTGMACSLCPVPRRTILSTGEAGNLGSPCPPRDVEPVLAV